MNVGLIATATRRFPSPDALTDSADLGGAATDATCFLAEVVRSQRERSAPTRDVGRATRKFDAGRRALGIADRVCHHAVRRSVLTDLLRAMNDYCDELPIHAILRKTRQHAFELRHGRHGVHAGTNPEAR